MKLKPITQDMEKDWKNITEAVLTAGKESPGYKLVKMKNWIRTWNEDIKFITDEKKHAYKIFTEQKHGGLYWL
jgi:general stress protein 26